MSRLKLISATDTQFPASVLKSVNEQRNSGLFCDVTIIVQDRKFKAHKVMLSASSTYFRQLFSVAGQVIELNFIKSEIFEVIINYIYTAKISRVRSDKLEDLIAAGQILGVKFIANLGVPLSQVKGLPGLSKDSEGNSGAGSEKNDSSTENMPIITESFSLSAEEFNLTGGSSEKDAEGDNDDIVFVSKSEPGKGGPKSQPSEIIDVDAEEGSCPPTRSERPTEGGQDASKDKSPATRQAEGGGTPSFPNSRPDPIMSPESINSVPGSPLGSSNHSQPTTPVRTNSLTPQLHSPPLPHDGLLDVPGCVQKKKVATILEQSSDQQGKIKLYDIGGSARNSHGQTLVSAKKTITLDKASEIDSLSPGCKVYANIGENTYDIVPVKDDPGEGDSRTGAGRKSAHGDDSPRGGGPIKKKAKTEAEDHYELIMDGKTFYVCAVCKRPYVCITSLRRHFNTHSWEKKYPCHFCDKVFALAEYRTKHELGHTGERRYQCLMCNEMFMNYQVLSSHCKTVHNQDPSGRKEKDDTENNLYRLLPCKTMQFKPYSYVTDDSMGGIPIINEDGIVQHISPGRSHFDNQELQPAGGGHHKVLSWDDIFVEPEAHTQPGADARPLPNPMPLPHRAPGGRGNADPSSEFEFVIPETY
ncbi:transcriptional regulator Kaiso [Engraulis encrasicolus]|uniref:transcriptional regulator Kaiso n=1 Tax=Engraulis encrasicolus TaxID=184585 RepID=UPI002FD39D3B